MVALILATKANKDPGFSNSTLIGGIMDGICHFIWEMKVIHKSLVAPLSVLFNWEKQIKEHCTPGTFSSCVYYGSSRRLSAAELQKYDIVITTYQTVTGEHNDGAAVGGAAKKRKRTDKNLFEMPWKVCSRSSFEYMLNEM
jgi:SWI/SNF-related matrix-associated actin-dependent regulator of chromatin subfamily A3